MTNTLTPDDKRLVEETFQRIAGDLGMIADRTIEVGAVNVELARARAAGRGGIHISFKLGMQHDGSILHGALVVPLADAITLGCYLMMVPDDGVKSKRNVSTLDPGLKDALMEVGNFVGGATDATLRGLGLDGIKVRSEGCQGVKPNVRPAFAYVEGSELLVGRAKLKIHTWPQFEAILMLPVLRPAAVSSPA
ncbi:MAG: hypothetical protein IPJ77_16480 [Planctomycetes bacterium]|nr:hypothetical protein [Planctomycetota bacterium]